jgi:hypothetical protein
MSESPSQATPNQANDPLTRSEVEAAAHDAALYLAGLNIEDTLNREPDEQGADGKVYNVGEDTPEVKGDLAVVYPDDLPVGPAHYHENGEWDTYFVVRGQVTIIHEDEVSELDSTSQDEESRRVTIEPGVVHRVIARGDAVYASLASPGYNQNNHKTVDPGAVPEGVRYNHELHEAVISQAT